MASHCKTMIICMTCRTEFSQEFEYNLHIDNDGVSCKNRGATQTIYKCEKCETRSQTEFEHQHHYNTEHGCQWIRSSWATCPKCCLLYTSPSPRD